MSPNLVRVFTCASILSLGGFITTASITACSSDPATPSGDDDDDTTKKDSGKSGDDDDTTGKTDAGNKTDAGDDADNCNPVGTWELQKPSYTVTAAGAVCDNFAKSGNANGGPTEVTITFENGKYKAVSGGATLILAAADDGCQIGGGLDPIGQNTVDGDGTKIVAKLTPTQFYDFDGDAITAKVNYLIESDPPGAKGVPCAMNQISAGTRKK